MRFLYRITAILAQKHGRMDPQNCRIIHFPKATDQRGQLVFADSNHLPFTPQRVFWISQVPPGQTRGGHAHATCAEVVIAVRGSFDIWTDDGSGRADFHLSDPQQGLYIGGNVWCELSNFSPDALCLVMASDDYHPEGYVNNYADFQANANRSL